MNFTIGLKKEMTQIFDKDGTVIPVTILDISDVIVAGFKTEQRDGYNAVVLGKGKKKKAIKALKNKYKELGFVPKYVFEFKVDELPEIKIGEKWFPNVDNAKFVKLTGKSKGKGFAGVVKRWGFAGGPKTHGQSDRHRAPGSIGSGTTPGRVYKGKKMAGRMGGEKVTIKNLKFVKVDKEAGLLFVKGGVVGAKNQPVLLWLT